MSDDRKHHEPGATSPEDELDAALPHDTEEALRESHRLAEANRLAGVKHEGGDVQHAHGPRVDELKGPPPPGGFLFPLGIVVVLIALVGVVVLWAKKAHAEKNESGTRQHEVSQGPLIRVVKVQEQPSTRVVSLPGEVHAWRQAALYAQGERLLEDDPPRQGRSGREEPAHRHARISRHRSASRRRRS